MKHFFLLLLFLSEIACTATSQITNAALFNKVPGRLAGLNQVSRNYLTVKNKNLLHDVDKPVFYTYDFFKQQLGKNKWLLEHTDDSLLYDISRQLYVKQYNTLTQLFYCFDYYSSLYSGYFENLGFENYILLLPAVLSAYDYRMNSGKGAGLWRLNYYIAIRYHLTINDTIDERFNVEKSTVAAIKYLKHLKNLYENFDYALCAFMSSAAEINYLNNKNGDMAGLSDIPDDIKLDLHLFKSLVFMYSFREDLHLKKYALEPLQPVNAVVLKRKIHFKPTIELLKMDSACFVFLNPIYKKFISTDTGIVIFHDTLVPLFTKYENDIFVKSDSLFINDYTFVDRNSSMDNSIGIIHTVRSGETLLQIAGKYKGVTVNSIVKANKLSSPDRIREGQKLIIKK